MQEQYSRERRAALEEIEEVARAQEYDPVPAEAEDDCPAVPPVEFFAGGPIQVPLEGEELEPELQGFDISLPESQSVLRIAPDGETEVMRIESPHPFPGPLRRLLYWVLLGWRWERP